MRHDQAEPRQLREHRLSLSAKRAVGRPSSWSRATMVGSSRTFASGDQIVLK